MGPDCWPRGHVDPPCRSAETAWRSGLTQTAPLNSVAGLSVVVAGEGPPYPGGAGSGGRGAGNPFASAGRCDAGRAGAACVGTGSSVAAGTGVSAKAEGIALGSPRMWAAPGPADAGGATGPSAAAAGGSWGYYAGLVTPQGQGAAAVGATSGEWPAGARPEKTVVEGRSEGAEGPEGAAEDHPPLLPHRVPCHHRTNRPSRSAAASGGGAGAGASVGAQLWPVAEPNRGTLGPAGLGAR